MCTNTRVTLSDTPEQRAMVEVLEPGTTVLLDDGKLELAVEARINADSVMCCVVNGGRLKSNKGINVPGLALPLPVLTAKDYEDLEFFLEADPPPT